MAELFKQPKKLERLKNILPHLDQLRDVIIKVIEQGGDIEFEWNNTGIVDKPSNGMFRELQSTGAQTFLFIIPPHDTSKK